jgi:hypothetical protein
METIAYLQAAETYEAAQPRQKKRKAAIASAAKKPQKSESAAHPPEDYAIVLPWMP